MDAATLLAMVNLVTLATKTYEQYANGTITAEQAQAMFAAASDGLGGAIDAFNAAAPPATA